jgi:hypothetical protein
VNGDNRVRATEQFQAVVKTIKICGFHRRRQYFRLSEWWVIRDCNVWNNSFVG